MLKTATLELAKRHFERTIETAKQYTTMAADALAARIAIDCIDMCIAHNKALQELARQDADIDALFERRDRKCREQD